MEKTIIGKIFEVSKAVPERSSYYVLSKMMEETGEISKEVAINAGDSYKKPDPDGVLGECIDLMTCCVDMIYINYPNITEQEIMAVMETKLAKWKQKANEHVKTNR